MYIPRMTGSSTIHYHTLLLENIKKDTITQFILPFNFVNLSQNTQAQRKNDKTRIH